MRPPTRRPQGLGLDKASERLGLGGLGKCEFCLWDDLESHLIVAVMTTSLVAANIRHHSLEGVSFLTNVPAVAQVTLQPQTHSRTLARTAYGKSSPRPSSKPREGFPPTALPAVWSVGPNLYFSSVRTQIESRSLETCVGIGRVT